MTVAGAKPVVLPSTPTIGVCDSGVGAITIVDELIGLAPHLPIVLGMDHANFPYGPKNEDELDGCVLQFAQDFYQRLPFSVLVVACNTASTVTLPLLRQRLPVPVVGVVPAIKPAAATSQSGVIGLLATTGTLTRQYTDELIQTFAGNCQVIRVASSRLVELAEAKLYGEPVAMDEIRRELAAFLAHTEVDTVVLGCTHFPILKDEIAEILGDRIRLLDSGAAVARQTLKVLGNVSVDGKNAPQRAAFSSGGQETMQKLAAALRQRGFSSNVFL